MSKAEANEAIKDLTDDAADFCTSVDALRVTVADNKANLQNALAASVPNPTEIATLAEALVASMNELEAAEGSLGAKARAMLEHVGNLLSVAAP
jgi:hypothetical protein